MNILTLLAVTALSPIISSEGTSEPTEPLRYARAYSVEIDENGNGTEGFYPLGVLGDKFRTGFNVFVGGNYSTLHATPEAAPNVGTQVVYGACIRACQKAWLDKKLPKAMRPDGRPLARRAVNLFDQESLEVIFRHARESVSNALTTADRQIFKWEIDNEFVPELDFSPQAIAAFRQWLPKWYKGDLEKFRKVWGTNAVDFASATGIDPEHCREQPGPFMDWIRFQQETFAQFLADYCKEIADADPKHRTVNGKDTQSSLEMLRLARARRANHELIGEAILPYTHGVRGIDHYGHGDRNAYEMNYFARTSTDLVWKPGRRQGVLYGENNNHNGPGWQWAETLWRMPPNGLKGGNIFCSGWFGCWGDWASFGFENPDGTKREKFWYLPRFFATIHRAERFFATSAPARGIPKVAMLLAQRDIPFGVDDNITPWGFPINSRLRVYSHLRDAGYAVDIIPYSHLKRECMADYQALFLVAAEHLADDDINDIREYVRGGGVLFADVRTGQFDEHNLARIDNDLTDVLGLKFKGIWESGDAVVDPGDVWFSTKYGRLVRGDGRIKYEATTAHTWNKRDALYYDNKAAVFCVNEFGRGKAYWTNTQMGTLRSESSDGEEPARDFFRTLLASAGIKPAYTASPDRGCDLRVETPLVDDRGNAVIMLTARTWKALEPMKLTMKLPSGLKFSKAFATLAEENRLMPIASRRSGGEVTFDLPKIRSAAAIYLMSDHAPLLGTYFRWNGATTAKDEVTPLIKPGETVSVAVQVANPSENAIKDAKLSLNALTGWKVICKKPLGIVVPAGAIAEAEYEVTLPLEGDELRPNHVQPLTADLFVDGHRVAVTHTVVQADVEKRGHELLLSDNWVSADCQWSVWNGAEYRYLTQPDEKKGEKITDLIWTTRADGQKVYALQSGDRADRRRYATYQKLKKVEFMWDLKRAYEITRILIRRGRGEGKFDPKSVTCTFSEDGKTFGATVEAEFVCDEKGFCMITLPSMARARYVRFAIDAGKHRKIELDDTWIFGKIPERTREVIVYGATPGGIAAAIEAKRHGRSVVLIEPSQHVGGLTTGGLGQTDIGNKAAFGGIALEFYRKVAKWYRDEKHWTRQKRNDYMPDGQCAGTKGEESMWTFEPSAAQAILDGWLRDEGIEVVYGQRLDRSANGVVKTNGRITEIRMESGETFHGKIFVDATYEGDLMAAAGVNYTVGREGNAVYGETINGIEREQTINHQFAEGVDPYIIKGNPASGLLPGVEEDVSEPDGTGDNRVQAYCFRMCLTDDPENRIPFAKPAGYRELDYELLLRSLEAEARVPEEKRVSWRRGAPWINSKMPNRKTDTNNRQAVSTDYIGQNYCWPEASYEERDEILKRHLNYQRGLMWTLANNPRVPEKVRSEVARWGTCRDEFTDGLGDGWQQQLYVREARRMIGEYVMTEHECRGSRKVPRPIAMGAYTIDSHNCRRYVGKDGFVHNEGNIEEHRKIDGKGRFGPYSIDLGAILPKRADCANLLVPVCISASHLAFGSIRMEPAFFALGHAAGATAALAIESQANVQDVDYEKLRRELLSEGQVIRIDAR